MEKTFYTSFVNLPTFNHDEIKQTLKNLGISDAHVRYDSMMMRGKILHNVSISWGATGGDLSTAVDNALSDMLKKEGFAARATMETSDGSEQNSWLTKVSKESRSDYSLQK